MALSKKIIVVDHSLKGFEGHHFEYSLASAKALSQYGAAAQVSCNKSFGQKLIDGISFQPDFSVGWTESTRGEKLRLWLQIVLRTFFGRAVPPYFGRFGSEMSKVLFARGQEIFVHTLSFTQLVEIAEIIPGQTAPPRFHIVLRYDPGNDSIFNLKNYFLKMLFHWIRSQEYDIQFYSDTPELCQNLNDRFGIPVKLLPILFENLKLNAAHPAPIKISYLGDAREEKGFQHLPMIIRSVLGKTSTAQFLIQLHLSKANESNAALRKAADEIRGLAANDSQRVVILSGALGPEPYKDLLERSDVILLPYDATAYRWRSSGILVQGAAAGKVVLVPCGTSMESMVGHIDGLTFSQPEDIPAKLIAICNNWQDYQQNALDKAKIWQDLHSPRRFAEQILD